MKINDIISSINPVAMTADDLWAVYTIVKMNNGGVVPMDEVDTVDYNYGIKAEKAKHRKSRKANIQKKNPRKRVKTMWYDVNYDEKRYDKYCKAVSSEKGKRKFRNSQATLFDYDKEVNFIKAEAAEAETDYAEYLRIENMSEEEKETKRNILKDALARYTISHGRMYDFTTERGTFMFDSCWDESLYLFKKDEEGKESYTSVYAIWDYSDGTYFDGDYDKVIEDMVKII